MQRHVASLILFFFVVYASGSPAFGFQDPPAASVVSAVDEPERLLAAAKAGMLADPTAAGLVAQRAAAISAQISDIRKRTITLATAYWLQAESLLRQNKAASALPIVNIAIKSISTIQPAIKLQGDLLQTRAGIERMSSQSQLALNDYQRAYEIFGKVHSARSEAVVLQNIGLIYLEANDLGKVFYYYNLAQETYPNDPMLTLSRSANLAGALFATKRFAETENEYLRACRLAVQLQNPTLEVQMLDNLARTQ